MFGPGLGAAVGGAGQNLRLHGPEHGGGASSVCGAVDLILRGRTVVDPESGLVARHDVGIAAGTIRAVTAQTLSGGTVLDVGGMSVAPGFIDLHSHGAFSIANQRLHLHDEVTTARDLKGRLLDVDMAAGALEGRALINFGASAGYLNARLLILDGLRSRRLADDVELVGVRGFASWLKSVLGMDLRATLDGATDGEVGRILATLDSEMARAGLGIGLLLDYMSAGVDRRELTRVLSHAARRRALVFVHLRRVAEPASPEGLPELIEVAEETGAAVHVCHITSAATSNVHLFLELIGAARRRGVDLSTEAYPYAAGSTFVGAQVFDRRLAGDFRNLLRRHRAGGNGRAAHARAVRGASRERPERGGHTPLQPDRVAEPAIAARHVIVASDAMPKASDADRAHPRTAGTFARVLRRLVRERRLLDLPTAIRQDDAAAGEAPRGVRARVRAQGPSAGGNGCGHRRVRCGNGFRHGDLRQAERAVRGYPHVLVGASWHCPTVESLRTPSTDSESGANRHRDKRRWERRPMARSVPSRMCAGPPRSHFPAAQRSHRLLERLPRRSREPLLDPDSSTVT